MIKIIVIDDDKDTVETLLELLELRQIDVVGVGYDGQEAVELYKKFKPDIILLDVLMPQYDGIYATNKIREINSNSKIIFLTGSKDEDMIKRLGELKPTEIIFKPYNFDDLIKKIEKVMASNILEN